MLELINQSTVAGEDVALSYNNQADYVRRIPRFLNQAILKIRTTVRPERRIAKLTGGSRIGDGILYPLPSDCRQFLSGGVWFLPDRGLPSDRGGLSDRQPPSGGGALSDRRSPSDREGMERTQHYQLLGQSILVPGRGGGMTADSLLLDGDYYVEYEAYPVQLPTDPDNSRIPPDDWELDETPEIIQAAEYYAAAMLVMMEDEFTYASLMNEYEDRRARMSPRATAETRSLEDPYAFYSGW